MIDVLNEHLNPNAGGPQKSQRLPCREISDFLHTRNNQPAVNEEKFSFADLISTIGRLGNGQSHMLAEFALAVDALCEALRNHCTVDVGGLRTGGRCAAVGNLSRILVGDYYYANYFSLLYNKSPSILKEGIDIMERLAEAEIIRRKQLCDFQITKGDIIKRIFRENALLVGFCCRASAEIAGLKLESIVDLKGYGLCLAMSMRIAGDLEKEMEPVKRQEELKHTFIYQGIPTLAFIHYLGTLEKGAGEQYKLTQSILNRNLGLDEYNQLQEAMGRQGSFQYARDTADIFLKSALKKLDRLEEGEGKNELKKKTEAWCKRNKKGMLQ